MKTMYKLWHWPEGVACGRERGFYDSIEAGIAATDVNDPARWKTSPRGNQYVPLPDGDRTGRYQGWMLEEVQIGETDAERIQLAVEIALDYSYRDGEHHKTWVIDQMLRTLLGDDDYAVAITEYRAGEEGPETYEWDTGVAP